LDQSAEQLKDEINAHIITKKELAEAKNAITIHEKHIDEQKKRLTNKN
jgi:hypothetical protein